MNTPSSEDSKNSLGRLYSPSTSNDFSKTYENSPPCPEIRLKEPSNELEASLSKAPFSLGENYLTPIQEPVSLTPDLTNSPYPILTSPLSIPFASVDNNTGNVLEAYMHNQHLSPMYNSRLLNDNFLSPNKKPIKLEKKSRWVKISNRILSLGSGKSKSLNY